MKQGLLFLDLGDVIWDECPAQQHMRSIALRFLQGVSEEEWFLAYRNVALSHVSNRFAETLRCLAADREQVELILDAVNQDFLCMPTERYVALHPIRHDFYSVIPAIRELCDVAIIANQHKKAEVLLSEYEIPKYVDYIALSDVCGYKKPDRAFFQYVSDQFQGDYAFRMMIGNRIDLDLIPARALGMKVTLFLCRNSWLNELVFYADFKPDYIANSFLDALRACKDSGTDIWQGGKRDGKNTEIR